MLSADLLSSKGLFTFYKEQEELNDIIQSLPKISKTEAKPHKSKSKANNNKSKSRKSKSKGQKLKSEALESEVTQSKVTAKRKQQKSLKLLKSSQGSKDEMSGKQKFLREIFSNKIRPLPLKKQEHSKTEGNERTYLHNSDDLENFKKPLRKIQRYQIQPVDNAEFSLPKPQISSRKAFEEVMRRKKCQINFYMPHALNLQLCSGLNLKPSAEQEHTDKHLSKAASQNVIKLPSISKNTMNKALQSISRIASYEIQPTYKSDGNHLKNPLMRLQKSSSKTVPRGHTEASKVQQTEISQIDLQGCEYKRDEKSWETRKALFLKKLGIQI